MPNRSRRPRLQVSSEDRNRFWVELQIQIEVSRRTDRPLHRFWAMQYAFDVPAEDLLDSDIGLAEAEERFDTYVSRGFGPEAVVLGGVKFYSLTALDVWKERIAAGEIPSWPLE